MDDVVFGTDVGHLLAGEISSVVRDDGVGDPDVTYFVLPEELDNLLPANLRKWHRLDPFGEVIGAYLEKATEVMLEGAVQLCLALIA